MSIADSLSMHEARKRREDAQVAADVLAAERVLAETERSMEFTLPEPVKISVGSLAGEFTHEITRLQVVRTVSAEEPGEPFYRATGWAYVLKADGTRHRGHAPYWKPLPDLLAETLLGGDESPGS